MKIHVIDGKNETKYRGMRDMEHEYKVGDMVRILEDEYVGEGLTIGSVHQVVKSGHDGVHLRGSSGCGFFYNLSEIEPYTTTTTTPDTQYIRILEAIAGKDSVDMARNINEALK